MEDRGPRGQAVNFNLREATLADLPAIREIYNHYVLTDTATWDLEPLSEGDMQAWFAERQAPYCALVAEVDGEVVAWCCLSRYRPRPGYRFTAEDTLYLRQDWRGRGIGRFMLGELIERGKLAGFHVIIARISGDNEVSIRLHEDFGFVQAGREREVGFKFQRWLDVVTMQRMLGEGPT